MKKTERVQFRLDSDQSQFLRNVTIELKQDQSAAMRLLIGVCQDLGLAATVTTLRKRLDRNK